MLKLRGLATGIGSLPHRDSEKAMDLIFAYVPQIPFWPQLPKKDVREGMVAQFCQNLPCLKVNDKGVSFYPEDKEKELERFYEKILSRDIEYFQISPDFACGLYALEKRLSAEPDLLEPIKYIKGHITGPFTFAASIKDEKGVALLHDPVLMQAVVEGLKMKALWQIRFLEKFGKKIIIFIDEPYLGCFGSAYTPINREDVVKVLADLSAAIIKTGMVSGVHCCGNTDWSIFVDAHIDIINFDTFGFLEKFVLYAQDLRRFSGDFCWGIIPTQEFTGKEKPEFFAAKLKAGIDTLSRKGLKREALLENMLLSPSCGLGTLTETQAEQIFQTLSKLSALIRENKII